MKKKYTLIKGGKIILENEILLNKALLFDEKIIDILEEENLSHRGLTNEMEIIDARGDYVSPGFIDIHIHGAGGRDTMDGEISALRIISQTIAKSGVTGFLPTTMSMEKQKIWKALDAIGEGMKADFKGAKILGAHMEGPFISAQYKGAHKEAYLCKPDFDFIRNYTDIIKIITLAPEEDPQFHFIRRVQEDCDIVLSMGHTAADYETAMAAIRHGVSHATHLFNAMPPFHHRAPGVLGAIFNSNISFELIADTVHTHPAIFQTLLNAKGKDKMILITDSIRAGFMKPGSWDLGGQTVMVNQDSVRLPDGTLAGSILKLNQAVGNILKYTDIKIFEAVALASLNPAKLLHVDHAKGSIEIGKDADLVIFDEALNIKRTLSAGETIFQSN